MKQSKKGNQWYFGMKAQIGVDAESGLVHTGRGTAGSVCDVVEANSLLHGEETDAFGDAGYRDVAKRPDAASDVNWHVAMQPSRRKALDKDRRGLVKNTAQLKTLFALSNPWMARKKLMALDGQVRSLGTEAA